MIDVKQAVKDAFEYTKSLYDSDELADFQLEEVELSEDEKFWLITISFNRPEIRKTTLPLELVPASKRIKDYERVYKVVKLRATDGQPLSIKIREL